MGNKHSLRRGAWRLVFLSSALLLWTPSAAAQVIAGRVVRQEDRTPVPLVLVRVIDHAEETISETTADSGGVFYAIVPRGGHYRVMLSSPGGTSATSPPIDVAGADVVEREFVLPASDVYAGLEVEKEVGVKPGSRQPRFPQSMLDEGISGEVLVQFVVDTTGRAILSTFKAVRATHFAFVQAVRDALPLMSFYPAEIRGRKVKQLVQEPFTFCLESSPCSEGFAKLPPLRLPPLRLPPN